MIKKLRRRVVIMSVTAVFVVLLALMGIVNIMNYRETTAQYDSVIEVLAEGGGRFKDFGTPSASDPSASGDQSADSQASTLPIPAQSRRLSLMPLTTASVRERTIS